MKLTVELTEEQLQLIIKSLEVTFRMMMPMQGSIVADLMMEYPDKSKMDDERWKRAFETYIANRDSAKHVFNAVNKIMYGDEYDIRIPHECHRISDMWSAIRHGMYELHPTDSWDVRSGTPVQLSDYPMIKVEVEE